MPDSTFFAMDFDDQKRLAFTVEKDAPMISPPVLNVYLAGPLTNNDKCVECACRDVREIAKRILSSYEYHGIRFNVYDPADTTPPGTNHTAEDVYDLDHERTMTADLVVFHVNVPSLGVGCECQISADASSPKVIIAKKGAPLSRMFAGVYSATLATIEYENPSDVEVRLSSELLATIAGMTIESAKHRRAIMETFEKSHLGRVIYGQRIAHNVPLAELARKTDTRPRWLWRLERFPSLMACCSPMRLMRIADVTKCYLQLGNLGTPPMLKPSDDTMNQEEKKSLSNLIDFALGRGDTFPGYPEDRVFRLWSAYQAECRETADLVTIEHREGQYQVITVGEWRERDQRLRLF
jgi:hypothetical protein